MTILDRIELRACTVEDAIDALKECAAVIVWGSIMDPIGWIHVLREGGGDGEGEEEVGWHQPWSGGVVALSTPLTLRAWSEGPFSDYSDTGPARTTMYLYAGGFSYEACI